MKGKPLFTNIHRLAPAGLLMAGLAVISAGIFYALKRSLSLPVQISLGLIVVGLALAVLLDPQRARALLTGRQARYGSNALLMTLAVAGILVVINYLAANNPVQWDLTEDQQNSLTAETVQALNSLKSPVKATAYFTAQMSSTSATNLLQSYKDHSKGSFDYEVVDPNTDPIRAQKDNITRDGTIVLRVDDRQEQIFYASEEEITSAMIRLANPGKRTVYFLTGHGEYGFDTSNQNNYSQLQSALTAKNYTVKTLNLLASPSIPDDALAIIVPGPTKPLSQQEVDLIKAYLDKGKSLVYLSEPRAVTEFGDAADPMTAYLAQAWGIQVDDDVVIDPSSNQVLLAISQKFNNHAITLKMYTKVIVMPSARSITVGQVPGDITVTPLAVSADLAWGETNIASIEQSQMKADQGEDVLGPVNLAVAGENSTTRARVVVMGDSDFAGTSGYSSYGNSDFIINSIDWAASQENLISLTARQPVQRYFAVPTRYTVGLILLGSVFLLPGLVLVAGITVWIQRRRRG